MKALFAPVALLTAWVALQHDARADDDLPGSSAGRKLVADNAADILTAAYPTARKLVSEKYIKGHKLNGGGFALSHRLRYKDADGDDAFVELKFTFTGQGMLKKIEESDRSSLWPAFGTMKLFLEAVKAAVRNDPQRRDDPAWQALLKVSEPEEFMVGYLNLRQLARK
jgi:hypothetical protein